MITQKRVKEIFDYKDGHLYRKLKTSKNGKIGFVSERLMQTGYLTIMIDKKAYLQHRIIFLYHYGYLPEFLDHINSIRNDNKIENLRSATKSQNGMNRDIQKNNTSGYSGITWYKNRRKWFTTIKVNNKAIFLGYYLNKDNAIKARKEAELKYFGQYMYN